MKSVLGNDPGSNPRIPDHRRERGARSKIFRFRGSERCVHWMLAAPFVVLYASAAAMIVFWGEPPPRRVHALVESIHRVAAVGFVALPALALLAGVADWRTHLDNLRQAWTWDRNDIRWLLLAPRAAVDHRITLPEQGKFNAAEKLNFMMVTATYPLYILTGILVWLPGVAFYPWIAHVAMAAAGLPLVGGHIYMATINPSTRVGLEGMFTGWVDREWAKHHYRRWYRQHFEDEAPGAPGARDATLLERPATIRCGSCRHLLGFESWEHLLQRVFQVEPLFCPQCHHEITRVSLEIDSELSSAILSHLENGRGEEPLERHARAA